MVYVVALSEDQLDRIDMELRLKQVFTKTVAAASLPRDPRPQITLLVRRSSAADQASPLVWLGVVRQPRGEKVAAVDSRVTVDLLRECPVPVSMHSVGQQLPLGVRDALSAASRREVTVLEDTISEALLTVLAQQHEKVRQLLDFLGEAATPERLDPQRRPEDASWQEQHEAARLAMATVGIPPARLAAWRRPVGRHEPFLAGLIAEPYEPSLIDYDMHHFFDGDDVFQSMGQPYVRNSLGSSFRCDIRVFEHLGRRIEIANVNASDVETRLGTDMIYYHEATQSFVLVQYKRLPHEARERWTRVDKRLLSQLDRLERVAALSRPAGMPHEWRLGPDPCFVKLAYWPLTETIDPGPAPGMYLSVPYVRLLLNDDATLGPNGGRRLGYPQVDRYLTNTEFTTLIKNGLVGTVGTTIQQLAELGAQRAEEDKMSVVLAVERATDPLRETVKERHKRNHSQGYDKTLANRLRRQRRSTPPIPGQQTFPES
ncbi:hypothetical protein [Streptomyces sp. cf124]|uniref:hypothetical protein n=1 Tax=Streptomyces sp. cf124 TaxID=1761903 RepID=UPI001160D670|nr:hypothetical protein [Streptomyces sp. cf124]